MKKLYSERYGVPGCRVRVYEPRAGASFMLARFVGGKYHTHSLGHRDRDKAKANACALIAEVTGGQDATPDVDPARLTIQALVALYLASEQHQGLKLRQQTEKQALLAKIVGYFGSGKRIAALDEDAVHGLLRARRKGTHGFGKPGPQSAYSCFAALRSIILWALKKKTASGARILRENPLAGISVRPNTTPAQPIIAHATYETLRRAARTLPPYVRVFLVVAEGTGRRAGAIRGLQWTDVDLRAGKILWRGETDKMGMEMHRTASRRVRRYLAIWRRQCPSSVWVFPAPEDVTRAVEKSTVSRWPQQMYDAAGLEKPARVGWHSLRRKWATERKGYAIPDLMAAGGWASAEALMRYLKTDAETIDKVICEPLRRAS